MKWNVEVMGTKHERTLVVTKASEREIEIERDENDMKVPQRAYTGVPSEYVGAATKTGDEEIKVGDKGLKCAVFRKTTEAYGTKVVHTEWRSEEIPGRIARRTLRLIFDTWSRFSRGRFSGNGSKRPIGRGFRLCTPGNVVQSICSF